MTSKTRIAKGLYWDEGVTLVEGCTRVSEGCKNCWGDCRELRPQLAELESKRILDGRTHDDLPWVKKMNYPTMAEVEKADRMQLCKWIRFLPPSSKSRNGKLARMKTILKNEHIINRVMDRLRILGGFTPEISKALEREK